MGLYALVVLLDLRLLRLVKRLQTDARIRASAAENSSTNKRVRTKAKEFLANFSPACSRVSILQRGGGRKESVQIGIDTLKKKGMLSKQSRWPTWCEALARTKVGWPAHMGRVFGVVLGSREREHLLKRRH